MPYRVIYGDTDLAGHMYYGTYARLYEAARAELLRASGATYRDWEHRFGVMLPVRVYHAEYMQPAYYDDLLMVHAWLEALTAVRFRFGYRIEREAQVVGTAMSEHPVVDVKTRRPVRRGLELAASCGLVVWRALEA